MNSYSWVTVIHVHDDRDNDCTIKKNLEPFGGVSHLTKKILEVFSYFQKNSDCGNL